MTVTAAPAPTLAAALRRAPAADPRGPRGLDLPGPSRRVHIEPMELPVPARRTAPPAAPDRRPAPDRAPSAPDRPAPVPDREPVPA